MPLAISYRDKYQLWADVFRAGNDQLFVPTVDDVPLGSTPTIEITLPDLTMPLVVQVR